VEVKRANLAAMIFVHEVGAAVPMAIGFVIDDDADVRASIEGLLESVGLGSEASQRRVRSDRRRNPHARVHAQCRTEG
jgi:FixJ family two-component response regulator